VECIFKPAFVEPPQLSSLTFERGSKLKEIGEHAFSLCPLLKSLHLPSSVSVLDGLSFVGWSTENVTVDWNNAHFFSAGDFLVAFRGMTRHDSPGVRCDRGFLLQVDLQSVLGRFRITDCDADRSRGVSAFPRASNRFLG
jgi:hypothetical protein